MRLTIIFVFAILIITSGSCRKGELIGREVQVGDNDILLFTTDSFHISGRTILAENERTDERFEGMLGAYIDPTFGPNVISYHSQYHLQEEGFEFPVDAVFDSVFVSFRLTGGYREKEIDSDESSLMHFEVYELDQDLFLDSVYFSDQQVSIQSNSIGQFIGDVNLFDSVYVGGDPQPAQIRIKMDDTWGDNLMKAGSSVYASNESFLDYMKGLAIVPIQTSSPTSNGAIFYFNPLSGFTGITLHYHTPTDTTKYSYITNSLTANFSTFQHDYSGTVVGGVLDDTASGSSQLYLQATIGTDIQIELKDIVAKFGAEPKIINLAELIIPVDTNELYYPLAKLSVSRKLEDGTAEFLPDQLQTGVRDIDGSLQSDSEGAYYRFLITQYIQEIIHDYTPTEEKSEILLISPFGNNTLANRSVLSGPRPTDPAAQKMRIRITYTPLN